MTNQNSLAASTVHHSDPSHLLELAERLVAQAKPGEQIEVAVSSGTSTSVRVYQGEVESFTAADNQGVGIRVIRDGKQGFASAGTLQDQILAATLADARDNAGFAEADPHAGLAEPDGVDAVDIELWNDSVDRMSVEAKIELATELERQVLTKDSRISGVRTSSYSDGSGAFALASTAGIRAASRAVSASIGIQALAVDGDRTQTGFASDGARRPDLLDVSSVANRAVAQAVDLIGASKPTTAKVDLVFDPRMAATVFGLIASTLTGDKINKGRSPFVDRLGEQVGASMLTLVDDPTDHRSLGADSHDGEGLACRANTLVVNGVLAGYLYDAYHARRAGLASTGSAVRGTRGLPSPGLQALSVAPGNDGDLETLIAGVDTGILVFSLAGLHSGVNPVSGDFSVGVEGRMIRDGELAEPISECTVGSSLQRLLLDISKLGSDQTFLPSGVSVPSLVIADVQMSGSTPE